MVDANFHLALPNHKSDNQTPTLTPLTLQPTPPKDRPAPTRGASWCSYYRHHASDAKINLTRNRSARLSIQAYNKVHNVYRVTAGFIEKADCCS
jgi:hypothetical protein